MLHDRTALVEVEKIAKFPGSPSLAQVRTPVGRTAACWCGDPAAGPGEYHVQWTVDEDIFWGRNAKAAVGDGPEIRPGGHCVVLRGRLNLTEDGAGMLDVDGTMILGLPACAAIVDRLTGGNRIDVTQLLPARVPRCTLTGLSHAAGLVVDQSKPRWPVRDDSIGALSRRTGCPRFDTRCSP